MLDGVLVDEGERERLGWCAYEGGEVLAGAAVGVAEPYVVAEVVHVQHQPPHAVLRHVNYEPIDRGIQIQIMQIDLKMQLNFKMLGETEDQGTEFNI
jgi:hypothetical protein